MVEDPYWGADSLVEGAEGHLLEGVAANDLEGASLERGTNGGELGM